MRRLEALEVDENGDNRKDPFDEVMGDGCAGHKRLVGLGVSRKDPYFWVCPLYKGDSVEIFAEIVYLL